MNILVKISCISALVVALASCNTNQDTTSHTKIDLTGSYAATGSGNTNGFNWSVSSTSATVICPVGTYIPSVIINNPPTSAGTTYSYTGPSITAQGIGIYMTTNPTDISAVTKTDSGTTATGQLLNGSNTILMVCVPASAVDKVTLG